MIQLVVVAPAIAMRTGLRSLLSAEPDLEVIAEVPSLVDLPSEALQADVFVLSPEEEGRLELAMLVEAAPGPIGVLLVSDQAETTQILSGLVLRGWGIVPVDVSADEIVTATRAVAEGLLVGTPGLMELLFASHLLVDRGVDDTLVEPLTEREVEVLGWLAQGLANKQIAATLDISEHTVKFHVSSIYAKLGATNRAEAVRLGARRGLIIL